MLFSELKQCMKNSGKLDYKTQHIPALYNINPEKKKFNKTVGS